MYEEARILSEIEQWVEKLPYRSVEIHIGTQSEKKTAAKTVPVPTEGVRVAGNEKR